MHRIRKLGKNNPVPRVGNTPTQSVFSKHRIPIQRAPVQDSQVGGTINAAESVRCRIDALTSQGFESDSWIFLQLLVAFDFPSDVTVCESVVRTNGNDAADAALKPVFGAYSIDSENMFLSRGDVRDLGLKPHLAAFVMATII
jgi:hypothetical protein